MQAIQEGTLPARSFWWDRGRLLDADVYPLRAVIFDLDCTLADLERDGHRVAFNAAFAAHGLDVVWTVEEYGRLVTIGDEERRIAAALRDRGFGTATDELAARVHRTKTELFGERILDGDVGPRPGLIDLVMSLFVSSIWVAVVTAEPRAWAEPLVRQLVGEGIAETIVTRDDVATPNPNVQAAYELALWELGVAPEHALAVAGSASGLRAAASAGLPAVVITTDYTADQDLTGATAVRPAYGGADPLLVAGCQQLHKRWWAAQKRAA